MVLKHLIIYKIASYNQIIQSKMATVLRLKKFLRALDNIQASERTPNRSSFPHTGYQLDAHCSSPCSSLVFTTCCFHDKFVAQDLGET